MAYIGKPVKTVIVPEPVQAPSWTTPVKQPEPVRVPVEVER